MATLETLLDVEAEIEAVLDSFLSAAPYSLGAVGSDSATLVTTPRINVVAEVQKWGPHQFTPTTGTYAGRAIYDQFLVRVSLDVVFQPEHAQGQGSIRGKLRKALTDWTGLQAAFAVRNYLHPTGDTLRQEDGGRSIDQEENTETLSTVLSFVAFLNQSAMAAAT